MTQAHPHAGTLTHHPDGLLHDALFYESDEELVDALAPFVRDGVRAGEAAVVVTTPANCELLGSALGADADRVTFVDAAGWYTRPARTIAGYHEVLDEHRRAGTPLVRVVGEVQFGSTPAQHVDWTRYESVLNEVFAGAPAWIVCPYDRRRLPADVLEAAAATHPFVIDADGRRPSPAYVEPRELMPRLPLPLPDAPARVELEVDGDLAKVRRLVWDLAVEAGAGPERADELAVAVNELTTNALRHGGGRAIVRLAVQGGALVGEVDDDGPGLRDPLAGYLPPAVGQIGGMGLWLARQFLDHLELARRHPAGLRARMVGRL